MKKCNKSVFVYPCPLQGTKQDLNAVSTNLNRIIERNLEWNKEIKTASTHLGQHNHTENRLFRK